MDQFYFQYEWSPVLRRRTRIEIEKVRLQQQLDVINVCVKIQVLCVLLITAVTPYGFLVIDKIEPLQSSLIYDAICFILVVCGFAQICARLRGASPESIRTMKNRKIESRWWPICITACLIPIAVLATFIGLNIPGFAIYPVALAIHELIILGDYLRKHRRVVREMRGWQRYLQNEMPNDDLPAQRDLRAV